VRHRLGGVPTAIHTTGSRAANELLQLMIPALAESVYYYNVLRPVEWTVLLAILDYAGCQSGADSGQGH